jgi:tryptophan-rich sensory protein
MNLRAWVRRLVAVIQIAGGGVGVVIVGSQLLKAPSVGTGLLMVFFLGWFAFGGVLGVALLERRRFAIRWARIFQASQIPWVMTPVFSYQFGSGLGVFVGTHGFGYLFGSTFHFGFMEGETEPGFALNVAALVLFVLLLVLFQSKSDHTANKVLEGSRGTANQRETGNESKESKGLRG